MSKATAKSNTPSTAMSGAGGGGSGSSNKNSMGMMLGIAAVVVVVLIVLVSVLSGGKKEAAPVDKKQQKLATTESAATGSRTTKVYADATPRGINAAPPADAPQPTQALNRYVDPVSGLEMVQTPNGPEPVESVVGRKYIEDFEALQLTQGGGTAATAAVVVNQQAVAATAAMQQEIATLKATTTDQVKSLDEKLNTAYASIDDLNALIKRQNETIVSMSNQVKTIQPIVKSSTELAKDLFGKDGAKVLFARNNTIQVDSIVGDKAYISDKDGNTTVVGMGDIVPGTSLKIKYIDPTTNTVTVSK